MYNIKAEYKVKPGISINELQDKLYLEHIRGYSYNGLNQYSNSYWLCEHRIIKIAIRVQEKYGNIKIWLEIDPKPFYEYNQDLVADITEALRVE